VVSSFVREKADNCVQTVMPFTKKLNLVGE